MTDQKATQEDCADAAIPEPWSERLVLCYPYLAASELREQRTEIERQRAELAANKWHGIAGLLKQRNDAMNECDGLRFMRLSELTYVREVLQNIRKQDGEGARESANDTLGWLDNRLHVTTSPGCTTGPNTWRSIDTAPEGIDILLWIVPKTAEESYCDGDGKPIVGTFKPRLMLGRKGSWSALAKATHLMAAPSAPTETSDAR